MACLEYINSLGYNNLEDLIGLKDDNIWYNIINYFDDDVKNFIELLFDSSLDNYPYHRKARINELSVTKLFEHHNFLAAMCVSHNSIELSNNLFIMIYEYINTDWVGLQKYQHYSMAEVARRIDECLNIRCVNGVVANYGYKHLSKRNYTWEKYCKKEATYDEYPYFAEFDAYTMEYNHLLSKKFPPTNNNITFVSEVLGDGYGFDFLSIDPDTGREKLIEVKKGNGMFFKIRQNEYLTARNLIGSNTDYYVNFYSFTGNQYVIHPFKYDADRNIFIGVNNPNLCFFVKDFTSKEQEVFITWLDEKVLRFASEKKRTLKLYHGK